MAHFTKRCTPFYQKCTPIPYISSRMPPLFLSNAIMATCVELYQKIDTALNRSPALTHNLLNSMNNYNYTPHSPERDKHSPLVKSEPIQRLSLNYEGNESTLGQQQRQHHQTDNNCEEMPHSKLEEEDCDFDLSFEDNEAEKAFLQDTDNRENQSQSGSQGPRPPTLGQIQYCIQVLQKVMPQMFTTNIVNIFFQKLFQKLAFSRLSPPVKAEQPDIDPSVKKEAMGLEDNVSKRSFVASQRGSLAHSNHGIRANMQKYAQIPIQRASSLANHSKIKVQDLNYLKRKTVIEAFCGGEGYEGVSTELARLALPLQIDKVSYDRILAEMMLQAYEKAEKVVATGYRIKQGPVVCAEPRSIQKVMVGCRRSLAPPTCQLIFSILLHYCSKGALVMDKDEAMRLLQGINAGLIKINEKLVQSFKSRQLNRSLIHEEKLKKSGGRSQKRDEASKKMKFELHRVWDNQFQKIMIDMYRAGHQIAQIRDKFCQTFPHDTRLFTIAALRSMFFKILRMAIRRLSQQVWKSGRKDLPQLVKLQDQLVKNIINCSECLQIRKLLIEIYIAEICGPTLLTETINLINQYSDSGGGVKKSAAMLQRFDDI